MKGRCEPYEIPQEEEVKKDLSSLDGKTVNKQGNIVDPQGNIFGRVVDGELKRLIGCAVDGQGQIWSKNGKVIGHADTIEGGDDGKAEGPFSNFESDQSLPRKVRTTWSKMLQDRLSVALSRAIRRSLLAGRSMTTEISLTRTETSLARQRGGSLKKSQREINPMAGLRVNKQGEVRDKNGDVIGMLTDGNLLECVGKEVNDNGYVVDQDGNRIGACTLLENIPEQEEEAAPTEEELKKEEEREVAKKISNILQDTISKMEPICKAITEVCLQIAPFLPKNIH